MIGCITQEAQATLEKRRKRREREDRPRMPASDAHHAAEGAVGHVTDEDEDCPPDMGKASREEGVAARIDGQHSGFSGDVLEAMEGPARPMMPGELGPEDVRRPYLGQGHAADSPANTASSDGSLLPGMRHADLTRSRGTLNFLDPADPAGAGWLAGRTQ